MRAHLALALLALAAAAADAAAAPPSAKRRGPIQAPPTPSSTVFIEWAGADDGSSSSRQQAAAASAATLDDGPAPAPAPAPPADIGALLGGKLVTPLPQDAASSSTGRLSAAAADADSSPQHQQPESVFARYGAVRFSSPDEAAASVAAFEANALPQQAQQSIKRMSLSPRLRPHELPSPECAGGSCPQMWGMDFINAPKLWQRLTSVPNSDDALATARFGMVIDSGVYFDHFDFSTGGSSLARSLSRTFNSDSLPMTDQGVPGNDVADGHGTHVAGIMAAGWGAGDDRGIAGVVGAKAQLASCRIFSDYAPAAPSEGSTVDEIKCLEHATSTKAFVVNISGGDYYPPSESVALDALRAAVKNYCASGAGVLVVSAGNDEKDLAGDPMYPAAFAGQPGMECVIAVAAVAQGGYMPWFSNYGRQVKIAAPGDWVASDWAPVAGALAFYGEQPALNGTSRAWTSLSGTSMAAPFVSGAALLLGNAFPKATPGQVRACLEESAAGRALGDPSNVPYDNPLITPASQGGFINGGVLDVDAAYDCVAKRLAGGTTCTAGKIVVDLQNGDEGLQCGQPLPTVPASAFVAKPDVSYSFRPPGPYKPGSVNYVSVIPSDGSAGCLLILEVKPCRLQCAAGDIILKHKDSGCAAAGAPFPAGSAAAAVVTAPPGVTYTASPPGPYPPGHKTVVTLSASDGSPSCQVSFDVKPCGVTCNPAVVRVPQSSGGGSCAPGGPGAAFPADKALTLDAPGVGYTLSPPGPYLTGARAVKVTPTVTGAHSCYVSLVVEACRLSCAATAQASLDAPGGGGCASSVPFPTTAIGAGAGVTYTLSPPGPFTTAGTYNVVATSNPGGDTCTTRLTVAPCSSAPPPPPPATITCAPQPVTVQLTRTSTAGSCNGATVAPTDLYTSTGGVTARVSPAGPYAPGTTTVRVTPSPGSPPSAVACDATVVVSPCAAECVDLSVPADQGKCSLAALPASGFVLDASKGRSATGVAASSPSPPFAVGATRVSAAVDYPGGVRSAPSPQCTLTVTDTQKPTASGLSPCLYPAGTGAYAAGATEACFSPDQLLSAVSDNCPAASVALAITKCANVSPSANGSTACRVASTSSVCVALRRLPNASRTPRVVAVTVRLTDAAGNSAEVSSRVRVFRRRPTSGADATCYSVSSTGAMVRRNNSTTRTTTGLGVGGPFATGVVVAGRLGA